MVQELSFVWTGRSPTLNIESLNIARWTSRVFDDVSKSFGVRIAFKCSKQSIFDPDFLPFMVRCVGMQPGDLHVSKGNNWVLLHGLKDGDQVEFPIGVAWWCDILDFPDPSEWFQRCGVLSNNGGSIIF